MDIIKKYNNLTVFANTENALDIINYAKKHIYKSTDEYPICKMIKGSKVEKNPTKEQIEFELDKVYNLIETLIGLKSDIDLLEYLPLTKQNKFNCSKSTLLAVCEYGSVETYEYVCAHAITLKAVPIDSLTVELKLEYSSVDIKSIQPLFQDINNPIKPKSIPKNIKQTDIKEGYIYETNTGAKYLYLGVGMTCKYCRYDETYNRISFNTDEQAIKDETFRELNREYKNGKGHLYIQLNSKILKLLETNGPMNYDQFIHMLVTYKTSEPVVRRSQSPRKFVKETSQFITDKKSLKKVYLFNCKDPYYYNMETITAFYIKID